MKFRFSIENFRGLAILFVMMSHLESFLYLGGAWQHLFFVFSGATSWFVFISGYLFAHLEFERFNFARYMARKAKFVMLPYLCFSALLVPLGIAAGLSAFHGMSPLAYTGWALLAGGQVVSPLWFMPMIFLLFLLTPMIHAWRTKPWFYVLALAALLLSLFSGRPAANANPFLSLLHFLGFYLLGVLTATHAKLIDGLSTRLTVWLIAAGGLVFVLAAMAYPGHDVGWLFWRDLGRPNWVEVGKLGLLLSVFLAFEKFFNQPNAVLGYIARISFGLFFVHGLYLGTVYKIMPYVDVHSASATLLLEAAVLLSLSFATVLIIKKLMGRRSRYVIGS